MNKCNITGRLLTPPPAMILHLLPVAMGALSFYLSGAFRMRLPAPSRNSIRSRNSKRRRSWGNFSLNFLANRVRSLSATGFVRDRATLSSGNLAQLALEISDDSPDGDSTV